MECEIQGEGLYRGVSAVMLFPISHPDRWISLRHTDDQDKEKEIGVIESILDLSDEDQGLVREALDKHYHEPVIQKVHSIRHKYGQLFFDVETETGRTQFVTPWRGDRAEDYGQSGKVILDALSNRYLIRDMNQLSPKERRLVTTYIYW
jgi:ATP-binding cassette, subfamily B, bacterial